jgi:hypothetical protein
MITFDNNSPHGRYEAKTNLFIIEIFNVPRRMCLIILNAIKTSAVCNTKIYVFHDTPTATALTK